ncbi:MAG: hypothetical protein ACP5RI_02300 [Candidatus Micrarchaeia archaeon]
MGFKISNMPQEKNSTSLNMKNVLCMSLTNGNRKFIPPEILLQPQSKNKRIRISRRLIRTLIFMVGCFIGGSVILTNSPMLSIILLIVVGISVIIFGWKNFSYHMLIENTPISKIESAPIGFNIFNTQFVPIEGSPLLTPISKKECVGYNIALFKIESDQNGSIYILLANTTKVVPSLLYDGTGYLVLLSTNLLPTVIKSTLNNTKTIEPGIDELDTIINTYNINTGSSIKENIKNNIINAMSKERVNPEIINEIKNEIINLNSGKDADFSKFNLQQGKFGSSDYILEEYYIPTNTNYISIGGVLHTNNKLNDKPVHILKRDDDTNLYSLKIGNEKKAESSYLHKSLFLFALGLLIILVAAAWGEYHNNYSCLRIVNNSEYSGCYYLNGTIIYYEYESINKSLSQPIIIPPNSSKQPINNTGQAPKTSNNNFLNTSSKLNCGNLNITDYDLSNTKYYNCSWSGGDISIFLQGGNSGHIGVKITNLDTGQIYYVKNSTVRCLTYMATVYMPKGNYKIYYNTGAGGGYCGPDILVMTNTT